MFCTKCAGEAYKGSNPRLHLSHSQMEQLAEFVNQMYQSVNGLAQIKLDVCWGDILASVPRLFEQMDCGAGDEFLSITSDRRIKPCSFHHWSIPFETLDDVRNYWWQKRHKRAAAQIAGCGRLPECGVECIL